MSSLQFEIQHRYRPAERLTVDHQRALVGSAAHCEIRLAPEDCAPEWLIFELRDNELLVEPLSTSPVPTFEGRPLVRGPLRSGATLQAGACTLTVTVFDPTGGVVKKRGTNPRVFVLAALFVALAGYAATRTDDDGGGYGLPEAVPALWPATAAACPEADPALAAARAYELESSADDKRERSPFVPRDGVLAVSLYRQAAACFRSANLGDQAREAQRDSTQLEATMTQSYHLARLRLERALVSGDGDTALAQISALKSMLEKQPGEYTAALNNLERRLLVSFGVKS